jgi:hypothetical protein
MKYKQSLSPFSNSPNWNTKRESNILLQILFFNLKICQKTLPSFFFLGRGRAETVTTVLSTGYYFNGPLQVRINGRQNLFWDTHHWGCITTRAFFPFFFSKVTLFITLKIKELHVFFNMSSPKSKKFQLLPLFSKFWQHVRDDDEIFWWSDNLAMTNARWMYIVGGGERLNLCPQRLCQLKHNVYLLQNVGNTLNKNKRERVKVQTCKW